MRANYQPSGGGKGKQTVATFEVKKSVMFIQTIAGMFSILKRNVAK